MDSTDFVKNFDAFLEAIGVVFAKDTVPIKSEIEKELTIASNKFMTQLLADAFLCLAMGQCRSVSQEYRNCVNTHSTLFYLYFGNESKRLVMRLTSAILKYRRMERTLQEMHNNLLHSNESLSGECMKNISEMSAFNCTVPVPYCKTKCTKIVNGCIEKTSQDWDMNVKRLKEYTDDFPKKGFLFQIMMIKYTIIRSVERLTEKRSPHFALIVSNNCGTLPDVMEAPRTPFRQHIPPRFMAHAVKTVIQLFKQEHLWNRLSDTFCNSPVTSSSSCWDGNRLHASFHDYDMPELIKDVRPRPKFQPSVIEGSAYPTWTDDEDLTESSGSGNPPDDEPYPYQTIERHPKEEVQQPSVVISDTPEPDTASTSFFLVPLAACIAWIWF